METTQVKQSRIGAGQVQVDSETGPGEVAEQYTETRVDRPGLRLAQAVWLVAGVFDVILAFDFLFRALRGGNTGFANFIYNLGGALGAPFDGIFGDTINNSGSGTIGIDRWGDLMAIAVYTLVATALVQLVRIVADSQDSVSKRSTTVR